MMNKIIILFIFSIGAFAKENGLIIHGNKNLPIEVNLTLEGLQPLPLSQENFDTLKTQIERIDVYATNLTKDEIFFIGKATFYKTLLVSAKKRQKNLFDSSSLSILSQAITNTPDPVLKWFLKALEKDANNLTRHSLYRDYLAARSSGKIEKIELKKIDRKAQLLYGWISKISPENPDLILKEISPLLQEILNKIEMSYYVLSQVSRPTPTLLPKKDAPLAFFTISEAPKVEISKRIAPSVNDIIDSVTDETPKMLPSALPKPSSEDWLLDSSESKEDL
jgi:hypothetical protein